MKTIRILLFLAAAAVTHADTLELANGNKLEGKVLEENTTDKTLTVEFSLGGTVTKRTVPFSAVKAILSGGQRRAPGASAVSEKPKTPADIRALIEKEGATDPEWLQGARSNHPKTLDLSWPEKPQGGWNNQKNMGQYIWDIVNPNSSRWREGVRLIYDLLKDSPPEDVKMRATKELANMYFRFFQDYARAAYWWQKAGVTVDDNPGIHLAECYWRLGSKEMALEFMKDAQYVSLDAIKLLGDMGETDRAIDMAEAYGEQEAWQQAGDACRLAGRIEEARKFYEKTVTTAATGQRAERQKRAQARAQASLDALNLFAAADVSKVRDGTYKDSSLGYEGQVEVSVKVSGGKIADVKVTNHKEKQYYSSLTDMPAQIIAKQGVKGVDATSRATITGNAILNATAKALAQGAP